MSHRYRMVQTKDQDGHPLWSIRTVEHAEDGTPVTLGSPAVALALPDDGLAPADSLRQQLEAQLAALEEPIVDAAGLAVDGPPAV